MKRVSRSWRSTASRNVANAVKTPEAIARAAFTGGHAPEAPWHPLNPASPAPRLPSGLCRTSRPWPGGRGYAFLFGREATNSVEGVEDGVGPGLGGVGVLENPKIGLPWHEFTCCSKYESIGYLLL